MRSLRSKIGLDISPRHGFHPRFLALATALALIPIQADAQTMLRDGGERAGSLTQLLVTMKPGQWAAVPNSRMASVAWNCSERPCPGNGPLASEIHGVEGPNGIMSDWSGGVLDTQSDSLIVWGGGHNGYYGNEVYAFSLNSLTWSMLTTPSSVAGYSGGGNLPDGRPNSQHTYGAIVYLPKTNQMFVAGGNDINGNSNPFAWLYSLTPKSWQRVADYPGKANPGTVASYDPATQNIFVTNSATFGLWEYNPTTNVWASHGAKPLADYHMTAAIDPIDHLLAAIGTGHIQSYSLSGGATGASSTPSATGDLTAQNGNAPGFVWDSAANLFIAWNGGSTLYTLDPRAWRWTARAAASGNKVAPPAPQPNGTFGRFQYDPSRNCFIVANDVNQDVYIYKPDF